MTNSLIHILRSFKKQKGYLFINFLGLTIGLSTAILIGKYVINEWNADAFIPEKERTFRLLRNSEINGSPYRIGVTSAPFATALEQDYPDDVETTTRVLNGHSIVAIADRRFEEEDYFYVDPNFISFFNYSLLHGDPNTALAKANQIVLTKNSAEKYFGATTEAMGKTLKIDNDTEVLIAGVFDEIPFQSHLHFDMVQSNQALYSTSFWSEWWSNGQVTYVRLNPKVSPNQFNAKLPNFMEKYFGDDFKRTGNKIGLELEPITATYFAADTRYDPVHHGNRSGVIVFLFAAILLIIVACINYINLSTATAITRSKEMAIHKMLGSGKALIVKRLLGESMLLTGIALVTALQISYWATPWFENLIDTPLTYQLPIWQILTAFLIIGLLISLASGLYPGLLMASFQAKNILKGNTLTGTKKTKKLREALVVFQYALSTILLCSTFVIKEQIDFLASKNLGFDKDHVLVIQVNNHEIGRQKEAFENELTKLPEIDKLSFMNGIPGGFHDATSIDLPQQQQQIRMRTAFVDFNYVETLGMKIVAGRNLNGNIASDSMQAVLLNEQAVQDIGMTTEEVIGQTIYMTSFDSIPKKVVGVLQNYHFTSLHHKIEPLVIRYSGRAGVIAIRMKSTDLNSSISAIAQAWSKLAPGFPMNYSFLDERLNNQYANELKQGSIFGFFAIVAILIACLGIFGLAAFTTSTRKKEISVRKVLGSSVIGIVNLLSVDFLKLVLTACIIAIPFTWFFMNKWLEEFAYKIQISWEVFFLAGIIGLSLSFITISLHSIKAALANPANSLREE